MLSTVHVLPRRVAVVTALVLLTLAWVVGAARLGPASAAQIDGAITNVDVVQTSAGPNDVMTLKLTWAVPDSAAPGDTFTLTLPPELRSVTSGFDLLAPDGSVVAVAKVVGDLVTFTVTDYVDSHDGVHGGAFFSVRWSVVSTPTSGPVDLTFTTSTEVFHDTVTKSVGPVVVDRTQPRKSGRWVDPQVTTGNDALAWTVDSPNGPFDRAVLQDEVGAGQAIDCSTVVYELGQGLDATGHAAHFQALPAGKVVSSSCSAGRLTLTAGPLLADQLIRIKYRVDITDPSLPSYTNSVDVRVDSTTFGTVVSRLNAHRAGGTGTGSPTSSTTPSSTTTSSTTTSGATTSGTTLGSKASASATSGSTSRGTTVLPRQATGSPGSAARLAYTGANVRATLAVAALLLGVGLLVTVGARSPRGRRRH